VPRSCRSRTQIARPNDSRVSRDGSADQISPHVSSRYAWSERATKKSTGAPPPAPPPVRGEILGGRRERRAAIRARFENGDIAMVAALLIVAGACQSALRRNTPT